MFSLKFVLPFLCQVHACLTSVVTHLMVHRRIAGSEVGGFTQR